MEKVENEEEKKKLINLGRFVVFLKQFEQNPKQYRKVVLQVETFDGFIKERNDHMIYENEEISESCDYICELLAVLTKYDILGCGEDDTSIWFWFYRIKDNDKKVILSVTCFKKEIYK